MSIEIFKAGILDTIQDGGRYGYQHYGINPGGSMDLMSAQIANLLVDNDKNDQVIELHFPAAAFKFNDDHLIAITGADFEPEVDGKPVPLNTSIIVSKNSVLKFKKYNSGAGAYMAVNGKWCIDKWLNSYSTNLKAKAGGNKGRPLKKDDVIEIQESEWKINSAVTTVILPVFSQLNSLVNDNAIRFTEGQEFDRLTDEGKNILVKEPFTITSQSDRMGYRLIGDSLSVVNNEQLLSSGVTRGTVQLLPSGQLVILMADHQTTGGYPKIAQVITADLSKLSQKRPKEEIRFEKISLMQAETALIEQHKTFLLQEEKIKAQLKKLQP